MRFVDNQDLPRIDLGPDKQARDNFEERAGTCGIDEWVREVDDREFSTLESTRSGSFDKEGLQ